MSVRLQHRLAVALDGGDHRGRLGRIIAWLLILLILVNIVDLALDTVADVYQHYHLLLDGVQVASMAIFTLEFLARLWVAGAPAPDRTEAPRHARWRYLTSLGWVDLIVLLPFYAGLATGEPFRFQVLRLLLLLKMTRFTPALGTLGRVLTAEWRSLVGSVLILLSLLLISATMMYYIENEAQPQLFSSIPAAAWWAMAALSTVGYGDMVPITPTGRVVASIVTILGIGVYALPVGIIASGFAREIQRRDFVVTWAMVARVPLFKSLDAEQVGRIANLLRSRVVPSGTAIVRRGEPGDCMYFIAAGSAEVQIQPKPVRLSDGDFFGEMALIHDAPRGATVVALTRCQLLILDADDFRSLAQSEPRIAAAIRAVAEQRRQQTPAQPPPAG
jgi:voltage-gated potassium channel